MLPVKTGSVPYPYWQRSEPLSWGGIELLIPLSVNVPLKGIERGSTRGVNIFKNFVKDFETFFETLRLLSGFWDFFRDFWVFPGI